MLLSFGKVSAQPHTIVKTNLFSLWKCIVFFIVFSSQELNAQFSMGLCGNFTLSLFDFRTTSHQCETVIKNCVKYKITGILIQIIRLISVFDK